MPLRTPGPRARARTRRGLTMIEMLVSVALLVLMMTAIVQVFTAATGAVSSARTFQELDTALRQFDATLRTDLQGVTARLTPPLNPRDNLGYFEYGENSFADIQGEDGDDYIRFTVKAPEGQHFTGRFRAKDPSYLTTNAEFIAYSQSQPVTVTSQYAEVIYFLRNGNLYRRVLLVAPDRQSAVSTKVNVAGQGPNAFSKNPPVSFQGLNDLSFHPNPTLNTVTLANQVILNTLGDLTNRENRFGSPRYCSDFVINSTNDNSASDGIPDDENPDPSTGNFVGDTVPDFYPTLYPNVFSITTPRPLINEPTSAGRTTPTTTTNAAMMQFPYVFPGAFSQPHAGTAAVGWIHSPDVNNPQLTLAHLNALNHNPLDVGDSLPTPENGMITAWTPIVPTWWCLPTWRETMSPNWNDGLSQVRNGQPLGLSRPTALPVGILPPMSGALTVGSKVGSPTTTPYRTSSQLYADANGFAGSDAFAALPTLPGYNLDDLWLQLWEDDLILTGVRSFDVKAYDNAYAGYVDLGWGSDLRLYTPYKAVAGLSAYLLGTTGTSLPAFFNWPPLNDASWAPANGVASYDLVGQTFAHEGRIPPLTTDNRVDPQYPFRSWQAAFGGDGLPNNIGDDSASTVRLRRVWDTWSTDYTNAPAVGVNPVNGHPWGPPFQAPIYPSYPPPYPQSLRGLRVQVRVVDPRNEKIKVLTITQDFSDKL